MKKTLMLKEFNILDDNEGYDDLTERVFSSITTIESKFETPEQDISAFRSRLVELFNNEVITPCTSILTNSGRYKNKSLSACAVPPINLCDDRSKIREIVDNYHQNGMGTGFNFDETDNPVEMIEYLNEIAIEGEKRGNQDRPVGNIGIISYDHPLIEEMVKLKGNYTTSKKWIFGISIILDEYFMNSLYRKKLYTLRDGRKKDPNLIMDLISEMVWHCGDPGIVFLERHENQNPVPQIGRYKSIAPCGEIALISGEACQFAYINVSKFVDGREINYANLKPVIHDLIRLLDDSLEISLMNYGNSTSKSVMASTRRIGLGICGFADMLTKMWVPYDSKETDIIAEDLMSYINYHSKIASIELAKKRGSFGAFKDSETKLGKGFLKNLFGRYKTNLIRPHDWEVVEDTISEYGLRNVTTTALPPTGRSSLIVRASASIEPYFSLHLSETMISDLYEKMDVLGYDTSTIKFTKNGALDRTSIPDDLKHLYMTCLEISPQRQLEIVSKFQKFTDNAISKTINLPNHVTPKDIRDIYISSYNLGLKGISVYRDGSRNEQPIKLR